MVTLETGVRHVRTSVPAPRVRMVPPVSVIVMDTAVSAPAGTLAITVRRR